MASETKAVETKDLALAGLRVALFVEDEYQVTERHARIHKSPCQTRL
jgi:hypothetical protein